MQCGQKICHKIDKGEERMSCLDTISKSISPETFVTSAHKFKMLQWTAKRDIFKENYTHIHDELTSQIAGDANLEFSTQWKHSFKIKVK